MVRILSGGRARVAKESLILVSGLPLRRIIAVRARCRRPRGIGASTLRIVAAGIESFSVILPLRQNWALLSRLSHEGLITAIRGWRFIEIAVRRSRL